MKVSLNWLKDYLKTDLDPNKISEILTDIGLEVEGMEEMESIKGGLTGVVVGHVEECGQHPNADRLSLTKVDVGKEEFLQIVCGAPNVAKGQKVLVATIGTTLYDKGGEAFRIKKGKIRGEASEGMICAEDELGLGDDHNGIIVLPETVSVGTLARDYFKVEKDIVYEIGLTPNRSDATCHIGVAKDLVAALKINYGHSGQVTEPSVAEFKVDNHDLPIEVLVENTEACPRYSGVSIKGVTIGESPAWLQNKLKAIGVRPISNIVDITNFVLHELGQPLHAFDYDKIEGGKIIVKTLPAGSTFNSLDEVERKLDQEDLMICDASSNGMCIAGVFGGINSGVKDKTKNIFLESAHFSAKWIRRSSTRHQLRTDAAKVFEKGSDPNVAVYALKRAAQMIKELTGGQIASEVIDVYPEKIEARQIAISFTNVNRLIGIEISPEKVKEILQALKMEIVTEDLAGLTVAVPTNKADVTREADIIEEILRIYGLNNVPLPTHMKSSMSIMPQPDPVVVRNSCGNLLIANGFYEMMAVSLTKSSYFKTILPVPEEELVYLNNTSNRDLDIMRPSMLFSGLEAIVYNQNRQQNNLRLFEFGKSYRRKNDDFEEKQHLSLFLTGQHSNESWLSKDNKTVSYYTLKTFVDNLMLRLGFKAYQATSFQNEILNYGMRYHQGPKNFVEFGNVQPGILREVGIKQAVLYADFAWDSILKALRKHKIDFTELSKFPSIRRDLALVIEKSVNFSDIVGIARKTGKQLLRDINLFDVYENESQLGAGKKSYAISFVFQDPTKTLRDKDVDKIMGKLIYLYENELAAVIRR